VNVFRVHGDGASLAKSYSRLGLALFARGKYPEAKAAHESALEIYRSTHDNRGQAHCLNYLALVAVDQGEFKRAASLLDEAHRLFVEVDSQEGLTVVRTIQGRSLLRRGKAREALPTLIEALELARQTGASISSSLCDIYLLVAEVNVELGDLKWAMDALAPVENVKNPQLAGRAQAIRARIYELQGDEPGAQGMYSAALTTFEQLGNPSGLLRTKQHYARYLAAQGSAESAKALRDATLAEAARIGLHL
jgi:tetratricopeptide (TPR) repeat protein